MLSVFLALLSPSHAFDPAPTMTVEGGGEAFVVTDATFVGDVDDDGYDDLAIARHGAVDLYYGGPGGPASEPDLTWYINSFAQDTGDVAPIGDVNGDGYDDLAMGLPGHHDGDDQVHVYYGSALGPSSQPDLVLADGPSTGLGAAFAHGDVDGDGYDDLLVGAPGVRLVRVYRGGPGGLDPVGVSDIPGPAMAGSFGADLAAGDADGDGHVDVLIGSRDGEGLATLAMGDGTGLSWSTLQLPHGGAVALVDFNGDGAATPVTGWGPEVQMHVGAWPDPAARQVIRTAAAGTQVWSVVDLSAPADVNGDGYDDLVSVGNLIRTTFYGGPSAVVSEDVSFSFNDDLMESASVGDADGDGQADLVGSAMVHAQLLLDAWGSATDHRWELEYSGMGLFGANLYALGDVVGDGLQDVGVLCLDFDALCVHPGTAGGIAATAASVVSGERFDGADVNGDGLGDVVARTDVGLELYLGAVGGLGAVPDQTLPIPVDGQTRDLWTEDVNGDGYDDVVVVYEPDDERRAMSIALGGLSGLRPFRRVGTHPSTFEYAEKAFLGFADLDGDGFLDMVAASSDKSDLVWVRGSASGPRGPALAFGLPAGKVPTLLVRGDFDGDGFDDLALTKDEWAGPPRPTAIVYGSAGGPDLARLLWVDREPLWAGDLNGDGRDDLVCARTLAGLGDGELAVHHGTAGGLVVQPDQVLSGVDGEGLGSAAVGGDFDGDGQIELVVGAYEWHAFTGRVLVFDQ